MKTKVVFFEVQGGTDKWLNGYRKDTMQMFDALKKRGQDAEVIFFVIRGICSIFVKFS